MITLAQSFNIVGREVNIPSGIRYSKLNIIQKINVKANRVACNTMYGIDVDGWIPIHTMYSDFEQQQRDYCSPFEFAIACCIPGFA